MDRLDRTHPRAAEYATTPRNPGRIALPDAQAEATNPACGDHLWLTLKLQGHRITEARFQAEGCAATVAAGSCLTEVLIGSTLAEARELTPEDLEVRLGGLPPGRFHALELAIRVTHLALQEVSEHAP